MKLDLHIHSTYSDGTETPETIFKISKEKELEIISITDHDNIESQHEAIQFSKGYNINYLTGVEIGCEFNSLLDVLGYGISIDNNSLKNQLNEIQSYRKNRNIIMLKKLNEIGINISIEDLQKEAGSEIIGRPHFASVMYKKKYTNSIRESFDKYLGDGKLAYIGKVKVTIDKALELINDANGYPVLAHPKYINLDDNDMNRFIRKLKNKGLWGLEVYYPSHSNKEIQYFSKLAKKNDLYVTSGSDYHGKNKEEIKLGMEINDEYFFRSMEIIKEKCL